MTTSAPVCEELTKEQMIRSDLRLADLPVSRHGDILTARSPAFPTWSWASVQGRRLVHNYVLAEWFRKGCRVQISAEITPSFGSLHSCQGFEPPRTLRLHGPLLSTTLTRRCSDDRHYCYYFCYPSKQPLVPLDVKPDYMITGNCEVYLLQVVVFPKPDLDFFHNYTLSMGLVLSPVKAESLTFQRVGTWENKLIPQKAGSI